MVDVWDLQVGDLIRERGNAGVLTVHRVDPPCSAGRAERHGPRIHARMRPGGYGTSFDAAIADRFERII